MKQFRNISILLVSVIVAGLLSACSSSLKEETKNEAIVSVVVATPSSNNNSGVQASGQIEAGQTAMVSTRVMGYITSIKVKAGDQVKQGQLLVTISNDDLMAKRAQVQASVSEAEAAAKVSAKDLDRFTQLYNKQSASAKELENVNLQNQSVHSKLEAARQMRNEVNAMLAYTRITAPFSGVITNKFMEAGSMANPGMPILALEQAKSFQAVIAVPEADVMKVQKKGMVKITVKSTGDTFMAPISEISPSSQFSGGQYIAKVAIPDKNAKKLKAGMYVNAFIEADGKQTAESLLTIPVESLVTKEDLTGVYVVSSDHQALLRWVRLGKKLGDRVEVLSGLSQNESFVLKAQGRIYNGAKLKITK
jgi:RND family efflux transporter MFP subunit